MSVWSNNRGAKVQFVGATTGLRLSALVQRGSVCIDGGYRLLRADVDRLRVVPTQRAVVLTAQASLRCQTWSIWDGHPSFEDDEERGPSSVEGYFSVDLLDRFPLAPGETCYALASMGTFLSNVVTITMP